MTPGVTDHGVVASTKSGRSWRTQASSEVKVGTSSERGVRTTAPEQRTVPSGASHIEERQNQRAGPANTNVVTPGTVRGWYALRSPA